MATLLSSTFTRYELSEDELKSGMTLTTENRQVLQNMLADSAELKINLVFNPESPGNFIQDEANLAGQIRILRFILDSAESVSASLSL